MSATRDECVIADVTALSPMTGAARAHGELRATPEGISIAGAPIVARAEIASANLWPSANFGTLVWSASALSRGDRTVVDWLAWLSRASSTPSRNADADDEKLAAALDEIAPARNAASPG